ncbi:FAD-dependent oxidoreductase [Kitasatospora sp. NPDC059571]|uniref:FAD-dependent oxidoreductase n=1 Tax=Kitasatospora sp. NPDC059571 TaxID=3346871 RepID=UPI0036A35109
MSADLHADVCVVGAGPGGLALALDLVRRGLDVAVLERSPDGRRDFRGESVSPDGVRLLDRLGVLGPLAGEALTVRRLEVADAGRPVLTVDFDGFGYRYRHPLEIPQPRLLAELTVAAERRAGFRLLRHWTATGLLRGGDGAVTGVLAATAHGPRQVRARLTVGADGRYSRVRDLAGLPAERRPLQRDVLWLRLPRPAEWTEPAYRVRIDGARHALVLPDSAGTVRMGLNIPKGGVRELRAAGTAALHDRIAELVPELADAAREQLHGWSEVALLDIFTATAPRWWAPGVVLLGDAAHTLSPVLGQGVNHALADAAALAPLIADRPGRPEEALGAYQAVREAAVARSRALQLRQERVFTWSGPLGGRARRGLYRALGASRALRARVLEPAYFADQKDRPENEKEPQWT